LKKTAELKVLPISVLKPADYNPRKKLKKGDKEYKKILDSIEEFGFADPLVVNADMTIIGGHQRLTVAQDLGYTEVPCAVVDIDKTREKALNIALNKITGQWDDHLLAELLEDIQNSGDFDIGKTGFDPPEIGELFTSSMTRMSKRITSISTRSWSSRSFQGRVTCSSSESTGSSAAIRPARKFTPV
jgi:site-specific DNA-methyltransferase (adenine-specific)